MKRRTPALILMMLAVVAGCSGGRDDRADAREPLRIAAATDLRLALPELLATYGDRDGPVAPPTFGASGDLAEQIRGGAPFDLFLSADMTLPEVLEAEGGVEPGSVVAYTRGSLVLAVHADAAVSVATLADLARPEIRKIAVADPNVAPYGRAARDALENAGLWGLLQPRIVPAGSVAQAFLHVEEGNADAALVSRSLVAGAKSRIVEIDPALYPPRVQGLGVVARSPRKDRARRFVAFLLGEDGRRVLAGHGFSPPNP